ncbi:hypothetical protein KEJ33_06325 [Candidatus Bathyarchaeota archaeon]|nr:hypothetical protein [Candidatus Bathyarchaeota archaeon]
MSGEGIKLRISRKKLALFSILVLVLIAAIYFIASYKPAGEEIKTWVYDGYELEFRADLREASKIQVPGEDQVHDLFWNEEVKNVTIGFKRTNDMGLTGIEAFEITYKLRLAYLIAKRDVGISAEELDSFANSNSTRQNPFVALIPPSISNETAIRVSENTVFISGKDSKDFDLITVKFLIIVLGIRLS